MRRYSPRLYCTANFLTDILYDDVNIFISTSDICFMRGPFRYPSSPGQASNREPSFRQEDMQGKSCLALPHPRLSYSAPQTKQVYLYFLTIYAIHMLILLTYGINLLVKKAGTEFLHIFCQPCRIL